MLPRRLTALRRIVTIIPAAGCMLAAFSCAPSEPTRTNPERTPATPGAPGAPGAVEPAQVEAPQPANSGFPHIRFVGSAIEIDGIVPIDCHHPDTPHVFLEVIACAPDTREHEALVMTRAKPSHIHAALLTRNLEAGSPGSWIWDGPGSRPTYNKPTGDEVEVFLRVTREDGSLDERPVREWVVDRDTGAMLPDAPFTFAGSRFVQYRGAEVYDADFAGNIIGLATFGNEVVAWTEVFSPDSTVDEPRWIANREVVPVFGTPVTIILRPAR
jgi:hypothetical protein